jgi:hypothetical protein
MTNREIVVLSWDGSAVVPTPSPLGAWSATTGPKAMFCGPFNADPWNDCAVVDNGQKLHVYLSTSATDFVESTPGPSIPAVGVVAVAHADGLADLLVRPSGDQESFTVLLNAGDGTFP